MTREFFERQAEKLRMACAVRRQVRQLEKADRRQRARRLAKRIHQLRNEGAEELTPEDKRMMRRLHKEGISADDIAKKYETDLITVAVVLERIA